MDGISAKAKKICLLLGKWEEIVGEIILYHGSNIKVEKPVIIKSKRLLDFGTG